MVGTDSEPDSRVRMNENTFTYSVQVIVGPSVFTPYALLRRALLRRGLALPGVVAWHVDLRVGAFFDRSKIGIVGTGDGGQGRGASLNGRCRCTGGEGGDVHGGWQLGVGVGHGHVVVHEAEADKILHEHAC